MGTSSFAHRVLLAVGFLVLATLAFLAVEIGVLGPTPQAWLRSHWYPLHDIYVLHKRVFDWAFLIVGTTVPAATGGLTILKGFYYAEINLPRRLQELVDRPREEHLHQRPQLLAYVREPFKTSDFLTPTILANPLSRILKTFGWVSLRNQAREFATSVDQLANEITVVASRKQDIENRKVTAHLIRGAYFSAKTSECESGSLEWRTNLESALAEYKAALVLRGNDLDALQGATAQCHLKRDDKSELRYLGVIVKEADRTEKIVVHARALRQAAAILDRRSHPDDWNQARRNLVTGWRLLEHQASDDTPEAAELAETLLLYGEVQRKREKFPAARRALNRARVLFGTVKNNLGDDGEKRVKNALNLLADASN